MFKQSICSVIWPCTGLAAWRCLQVMNMRWLRLMELLLTLKEQISDLVQLLHAQDARW